MKPYFFKILSGDEEIYRIALNHSGADVFVEFDILSEKNGAYKVGKFINPDECAFYLWAGEKFNGNINYSC